MSELRALLRGMLEEPEHVGDEEGGTVMEALLELAIERARGNTADLKVLLELADGVQGEGDSQGAGAGHLTIQVVGPDGQPTPVQAQQPPHPEEAPEAEPDAAESE